MKLQVLCDKVNRVFWVIGEETDDRDKWDKFHAYIKKNEDRLNLPTMCNFCSPNATRKGSTWEMQWDCTEGTDMDPFNEAHQEFISRPLIPIRDFDKAIHKYDTIKVDTVLELIDEFEKQYGIDITKN